MRILFLTNLLPYPLDNGGKIKTYTTIKSFFRTGYEVDLLCFKEQDDLMFEEESEMLKMCKSVNQVQLTLTTAGNEKYMIGIAIKSLFSKLPFSIYKYKSKKMLENIYSKDGELYDVVYFDHLPMCVYLKDVRKLWPKARIILDEHNCESNITRRKEKESKIFLKKCFLKLENYKLEKFETYSINNVSKTIIVSKEDYNSLRLLLKKEFEHEIIPIGVPDRGLKKNKYTNTLKILFIGTLTWEPNNLGLIWFLKEVMPIIESKKINYHLYIVGRNPSSDVKKLCEKYKNSITITGYVDSVDEYYDKCDCTIVPLFIGSGQRVKLIEAFSKGMPAISTEIGAEGLEYINNESIIIANDKETFADAILLMQNEKIRLKLGDNGRKIYDKLYSTKAIEKIISSAVNIR